MNFRLSEDKNDFMKISPAEGGAFKRSPRTLLYASALDDAGGSETHYIALRRRTNALSCPLSRREDDILLMHAPYAVHSEVAEYLVPEKEQRMRLPIMR